MSNQTISSSTQRNATTTEDQASAHAGLVDLVLEGTSVGNTIHSVHRASCDVSETSRKANLFFEKSTNMLDAIARAVSGLAETMEGLNVIELTFALCDLCKLAWNEKRSVYDCMSVASRTFSACGYKPHELPMLTKAWLNGLFVSKNVNVETDEGYEHAVACSFEPAALGETIVSFLVTAVTGAGADLGAIRRANELMRFQQSLVKGSYASSLVDFVSDYLPACVEGVVAAIIPARWAAMFYSGPMYRRWMEKLQSLTIHSSDSAMMCNPDFQEKVIDCFAEVSRLMRENGAVMKWQKVKYDAFQKETKVLEKMFHSVAVELETDQKVMTPFCFMIYGPSGVGKSTFLETFLRALTRNPSGRLDVYQRNLLDKFWSGYWGQTILAYDEFASNSENMGPSEIIQVVTNNPFRPELPSVGEGVGDRKGKKARLDIVAILSNVGLPMDPKVIHSAAFFRRLMMHIEMVWRDEYRGQTISQIPDHILKNFDHAHFYVRNAMNPGAPAYGPLTASQLIRLAVSTYDAHRAHEAEMLQSGFCGKFVADLDLPPEDAKTRAPILRDGPRVQWPDWQSASPSIGKGKADTKVHCFDHMISKPEKAVNYDDLDPEVQYTWSEKGFVPVVDCESAEACAGIEDNAAKLFRLRTKLAETKAEADGSAQESDENFAERVEEETKSWLERFREKCPIGGKFILALLGAGALVSGVTLLAKFWRSEESEAHAYHVPEHGKAQAKLPIHVKEYAKPHHAVENENIINEMSKVRKNCITMYAGGRISSALCIGGTRFLTVSHFFYDAAGRPFEDGEVIRLKWNDSQFVDVLWSTNMLVTVFDHHTPGQRGDVCIVDFGNQVPGQMKRIAHMFWSEKDLALFRSGKQWAYCYTRGDEPAWITVLRPKHMTNAVGYDVCGEQKVLSKMMAKYEGPVSKGHSGCAVLTTENAAYRLVGVHVAGSGEFGYAALVTREMVSPYVYTEEAHAQSELNVYVDTEKEGKSLPGLLNMGRLRNQYPNRQSERTNIQPSLLHQSLGEIPKRPARLRAGVNSKGEKVSPLMKSLQKLAGVTRMPIGRLMDRAVKEVIDVLAAQLAGEDLSPLTDEEAVFGTTEEYVDRLKPNSSSGYPFKWKHPGLKGKKHLIDYENRTVSDELMAEVHAREESYKKGKPYLTMASGALKDELRPNAKVEEGSTRLFMVMPLDMNILCRKYLLRFCAALSRTRTAKSECQVGINPTSEHWADLFNDLSEVSDVGFCTDAKNHDALMSNIKGYLIMCIVLGVFASVAPEVVTEEFTTLLFTMARDLNFNYIAILNVVYQMCGVLPSGCIMTVIWNTILDMLERRYCWLCLEELPAVPTAENDSFWDDFERFRDLLVDAHRAMNACLSENHLSSFEAYNLFTRTKYYGDDNAGSVSRQITHWWNYQVFRALMRVYVNWEITPPTKEQSETYTVEPIMDFEFLKRGFRLDQNLCTVGPVGPLVWDSVKSQCQWISKNGDPEELLAMNCRQSLREAVLHGREAFNSWREQLLAAYREINRHVSLPTYEEVATQYRNGGFEYDWTKPWKQSGTESAEAHCDVEEPSKEECEAFLCKEPRTRCPLCTECTYCAKCDFCTQCARDNEIIESADTWTVRYCRQCGQKAYVDEVEECQACCGQNCGVHLPVVERAESHSASVPVPAPSIAETNTASGEEAVTSFGATVSAQPEMAETTGTFDEHREDLVSRDVDVPLQLDSASSKYVLLGSVDVPLSLGPGDLIHQWALPLRLYQNNMLTRVGFATAQFWKGAIDLVVTVTGNRFMSGLIGVGWMPLPCEGTFGTYNNIKKMTSLPGFQLLRVAGAQTGVITIKWAHIYSAYRAKSSDYGKELAQFVVFSVAPLVAPAGAQGSVAVNVYARLRDSTFSVPQVSGISPIEVAESHSAIQKARGHVKNARTAVQNAHSGVMGMVQGALKGAKKAADIVANPLNLLDLFFDKPNDPQESLRVVKDLPSLAALDGLTVHDSLSPSTNHEYVVDPGAVGTAEDETNCEAMATRLACIDVIEVPMSSAHATLLFTHDISYLGELNGHATGETYLSPLARTALFFDFYRGATNFVFEFSCAQQVSGRFIAAITYGQSSAPTFQEAMEGYFVQFDLNTENQQLRITADYVSNRPVHRNRPGDHTTNPLGVLTLWTVGRMNAPSNVPAIFHIAVFKGAAPGCKFYYPGALMTRFGIGYAWTFAPPSQSVERVEPEVEDAEAHSDLSTQANMEEMAEQTGVVVTAAGGDKAIPAHLGEVKSFAELFKRFTPGHPIPLVSNYRVTVDGSNVMIAHGYVGVADFLTANAGSAIGALSTMFALWGGDMRFKVRIRPCYQTERWQQFVPQTILPEGESWKRETLMNPVPDWICYIGFTTQPQVDDSYTNAFSAFMANFRAPEPASSNLAFEQKTHAWTPLAWCDSSHPVAQFQVPFATEYNALLTQFAGDEHFNPGFIHFCVVSQDVSGAFPKNTRFMCEPQVAGGDGFRLSTWRAVSPVTIEKATLGGNDVWSVYPSYFTGPP